MLNHSRQEQCRLPQRTGRKPNKVLQQVPMVRIPWDEQEPGHFEVDLVHHSGPITSGDYICSLQMIDVATAWSERAAVLGRSYVVMQDAFQYLLTHIPFPVLEVHPDNDSAFFNQHMFRFWGDKVANAHLSRSRPYHKNDNPRVEQKNASLVRAFLGYDRLDSVAQTRALNALYDQMWLYYNLFQPVMHLVEKEVIRVAGQPTRVKRCYDDATTPFDRLCRTNAILPRHRQQLDALRHATNPRRLRQDIYDAIDTLFQLPGAVPGITENVYQTLTQQKGDDDPWLNLAFDRTRIK